MRQQLRWVALAVAVTVAASVALVLVGLFLPALALTWVYEVVTVLGFGLAFPVAVSVAILRYRLFDLDRMIRRTLVYTVVSALLASVYAGAVLVLQAFVRAGTGERSDLAVVVSTLAIAALFTPLRRRVQRWVDRRFYRARFDAERALRAVALRLRHEVVPEELARAVLGVIEATMQPERVSLWLRGDAPVGRPAEGASAGRQADGPRRPEDAAAQEGHRVADRGAPA